MLSFGKILKFCQNLINNDRTNNISSTLDLCLRPKLKVVVFLSKKEKDSVGLEVFLKPYGKYKSIRSGVKFDYLFRLSGLYP